jgi:YARHG domain
MRWLLMAVAMITVAASLAAAPALAQTCQQLWVERNQYYKNHGFCFKTQRAIEYFGNGGCYIHDENAVAMIPDERARIAQIAQQERAMGCNIDGGGGNTGMTCDQLWIARNSIYKMRGYCFKTQRAIQHFGNGGCIHQNEDDIPFTQGERTLMAQYVAQERAQGCQ